MNIQINIIKLSSKYGDFLFLKVVGARHPLGKYVSEYTLGGEGLTPLGSDSIIEQNTHLPYVTYNFQAYKKLWVNI